eukprot:CAMPEP_0177671918 /NCGR_PEP_ID=MMETSP0447-20121125/25013_1 /TAXON_ID=0 /ORGANISM="Stygamoeba regulata, Strain BSH-02190019" /LENGTH=164 /DNA_ID=CAMNT_0019179449 /DNA_START=23 /DNA_END=517 /DNA_ORIENTATION=+
MLPSSSTQPSVSLSAASSPSSLSSSSSSCSSSSVPKKRGSAASQAWRTDMPPLRSRSGRVSAPTSGSSFSTRFPPARRAWQSRRTDPPYGSICFALLLLLGGLIATSLGVAHLCGHVDARVEENGYHLVGLGSLLLLPGAYVSFVAFASWRGWRGYDYSLIPGY